MQTAHKFTLQQEVKIIACDNIKAIVRSIKIDLRGITYYVTYFNDGKMEEVYLWEHELTA